MFLQVLAIHFTITTYSKCTFAGSNLQSGQETSMPMMVFRLLHLHHEKLFLVGSPVFNILALQSLLHV